MGERLRSPAPGEPTMSILEIAIRRAGFRRGTRAVAVLQTWVVAEQKIGRPLGEPEGGHITAAVREYAEWWKKSERTAWRDLDRFREAFPEEESPARLSAMVIAQGAENVDEGLLALRPAAV